jgi:hypothetical protein
VVPLLAFALVIGLMAARAPEALSAPAGDRGQGLVLSLFELKGTHGYTIEGGELREGTFPPTVSLAAQRKGLRANYEVPGDLGLGIHAVFGSLGNVALEFHRKKRAVDRPEKGCTWITETGVFRGRLAFIGEGGYTAVDTTAVPGQVVRLPNGFCGFGDDRRGTPPSPNPLSAIRLAARARIAHGFAQFEAIATAFNSGVTFEALVREGLGPMTISRSATAAGAKDTFAPDPNEPRPVVVHPPPPFEGSARFSQSTGSAPTWTGSLSVALPGMPTPTILAGAGFAARLCLRSSLLGSCKVALPPIA